MGKMILDDLRKRLERLDEDADLMIDNNDRYQMVIVGGSAFILLGKLTRATHDIDALSVPKELYSLLGKYDINTDVEAYIDNFPYNFQEPLQPHRRRRLWIVIQHLALQTERPPVSALLHHR